MKSEKIQKETDCSRVYKLALRYRVSGCPICPPHRGCNKNRKPDRSWKNYRDTRWK